MNAAEKLRAIAQEIRETPEHWTQQATARTAKGTRLGSSLGAALDSRAACWCSAGLLVRDFIDDPNDTAALWCSPAYGALSDAVEGEPVAWNDDPQRTAAEVADAFDAAAVLVEGADA